MLNIETQINEFKTLDQQIKQLTAQRDEIKKELIDTYFNEHETFVNDNGQLLATYKEQIRVQLNQKLSQEQKPALYDQYAELKAIRVFLCK